MTMRMILLSIAILSASLGAAAQDWNQWRGPARTGVASAFKPPS